MPVCNPRHTGSTTRNITHTVVNINYTDTEGPTHGRETTCLFQTQNTDVLSFSYNSDPALEKTTGGLCHTIHLWWTHSVLTSPRVTTLQSVIHNALGATTVHDEAGPPPYSSGADVTASQNRHG